MVNKEKITISIGSDLLSRVDDKIDKIHLKNRSHVIDNLLREGLKLRQDVGAIIIANENNWNDCDYPINYPKSLIRIDSKTVLEKQLELLKKANIEKVVIAIGYEGNKIIEFVKSKNFGIEIEFLKFDKNDESQKIIEAASKVIKANKYLVMLGDTYFHDLSLTDFIYYHNTSNVDLSIIVKPIDVSEGYGNIKLEGNNIVKFVEKPKIKEDISFIINTGIYLMDKSIIPEGYGNKKIEIDFFPGYVEQNKVKAYFHNGKWFHMQDTKTLNLFN